MILVITNNDDIVKITSKYLDIKKCIVENVEDINTYIDKDLMSKKMELFDKIIIDINSLKNTNEEILKSIARIKVIYDIQIVIIAIGFKVGNELLSNLFELGIYDFIISEDKSFQDEEFRKAMTGNNYIDSIKFRIQDRTKKVKKNKVKKKIIKDNKKKLRQVSKQKILACFSFIKNIIFDIIKVLGYVVLMFFVSVGATALINANIREILIQIIRGGI